MFSQFPNTKHFFLKVFANRVNSFVQVLNWIYLEEKGKNSQENKWELQNSHSFFSSVLEVDKGLPCWSWVDQLASHPCLTRFIILTLYSRKGGGSGDNYGLEGIPHSFKKKVPVKGTVKEKWKGYKLKADHCSSRSLPMKVISDVPISRNWFTTNLSLQTNQKEKFKFNWQYCFYFVTPSLL